MGKLNLPSQTLGALGAVVKGEARMAHLTFSLLVIGTAAAAVQMSALKSVSFLAVAATFFAMWAAYSAAVAAIFGRNGFGRALRKALFLDSLTYLPMFLLLIAKAATSVAGIDAGRYGPFGDIPVAMAFSIAIAANIAGKVILFPKNIEEILDNACIKKRVKLTVAAAVVAYLLFFSVVTVMKHNSFNTTAFDLAIFDQTLWGYSNGQAIFNTVRGLNLLEDHMQPILFLIAPLYKFLPMPQALLVLQSLALALGALPIYWIARKRLGAAAAAMISASYLVYPSLQYINLFDFHPEALATPLLLFAIYFVDVRKYFLAAAMLVLTGVGKEHFPLALVTFGAYIFLLQKKKIIGGVMAAAGIGWLALNFGVLLPHFSGGQGYGYVTWYSYLGNSLLEAAKNAILHPQLLIARLLSPDTFSYAALLLLPLGGGTVALLGLPQLLLGAPFFAINFLRGQDITTALIYQYNAELIPFLYLATIAGAQRMAKLLAMLKLDNTRIAVSAFVLLSAIGAGFAYGPFSTLYDVKDFTPSQHTAAANRLLNEIPKDAPVSADQTLLPHLTHRKVAYMFPNPFIRLMFGKGNVTAGNNSNISDVEYVIMDLSRAGPTYDAEQYAAFVAKFINNTSYGLVALEDSYALFKKGGNYSEGVCRLDSYFKTSADAAVRVDLDKTLGDKGRMLLKQC